MNRKLLVLSVAFLVLAVVVFGVFSMSSFASPSENASGSWYYIPTVSEQKVVGGNTIITGTEVGNWTGTFHGHSQDCFDMEPPIFDCAVSEGIARVTFHRDGHWNYEATIQFPSVTVDGKTGGLELRVGGKFPSASNEWEGRWTITGGTGELASLRGQGTWWGPGYVPPPEGEPEVPGLLQYSGNIHFDAD